MDDAATAIEPGRMPRTEDDLVQRAMAITSRLFDLAAKSDREEAVPSAELRLLFEAGLLLAPFPPTWGGGVGLGSPQGGSVGATFTILRLLGWASLPVGRLFEGHLNAIALVGRYGTQANLNLLYREAAEGRLTGVWMAETGDGLRLTASENAVLTGAKIFCSGAGFIRRPLVAAALAGSAGPQMVIPYVPAGVRSSTRSWRAVGMKATATGDVDFTGLAVAPDELVGNPNDYYQSPYFRGGAWRVLAVQLGGLERLFELYRAQLAAAPQSPGDRQLGRIGEAATELETARLWVTEAALIAGRDADDALAIDAYVDLARGAFERSAEALMATVQRGLGLRSLIAPNPIERLLRDLMTYLRQPALDLSLLSASEFILRGDRLPTAATGSMPAQRLPE